MHVRARICVSYFIIFIVYLHLYELASFDGCERNRCWSSAGVSRLSLREAFPPSLYIPHTKSDEEQENNCLFFFLCVCNLPCGTAQLCGCTVSGSSWKAKTTATNYVCYRMTKWCTADHSRHHVMRNISILRAHRRTRRQP